MSSTAVTSRALTCWCSTLHIPPARSSAIPDHDGNALASGWGAFFADYCSLSINDSRPRFPSLAQAESTSFTNSRASVK